MGDAQVCVCGGGGTGGEQLQATRGLRPQSADRATPAAAHTLLIYRPAHMA